MTTEEAEELVRVASRGSIGDCVDACVAVARAGLE